MLYNYKTRKTLALQRERERERVVIKHKLHGVTFGQLLGYKRCGK